MLSVIFKQELAQLLRRPLIYLFVALLFGISFLTMWGAASEANGLEVFNAPFRLHFMSGYFSVLLVFLMPSVVGASIHRDYQSKMHSLLYVLPLRKRDYLVGKFGAAFLVVFGVSMSIGLGFALGATMPGIAPEVIGGFSAAAYLQLYGLFLLPNLLLLGLVIFLVVIQSRNIYLAFIVGIGLVAIQTILSSVLGSSSATIALLDPSGSAAVRQIVADWTLHERNTQLLPVEGLVLINRIIWGCFTLVLGGHTYRQFSFSQFARGNTLSPRADKSLWTDAFRDGRLTGLAITTEASNKVAKDSLALIQFSPVDQPLGFWSKTRQIFALARHNTCYIVSSYPFLAILFVGGIAVLLQQLQMSPPYGFATWPTTANLLKTPMLMFGLTINLVTFLYVGFLAQRGERTGMADLVDATPVPAGTLLLGRLLAVLGVQLLLLSLVMLGGIATQIIKGYGRIEIWHYLTELFGLHFIHFVIWACLATLVHTLIRGLYTGFFVLLITASAFSLLAEVGHYLDWPILADSTIQFNTTPRVLGGFNYSDWNGYGDVIPHYLVYKFYWLLFGIICLGLALVFWRRGYQFSCKEWLQSARQRLADRPLRPVLSVITAVFLLLGTGLYYHDHQLATFGVSGSEKSGILAHHELRYARYLSCPQPRIARAEVKVDIFPTQRTYRAAGSLWFVNRIDRPLDTILVKTSFKDETEFKLSTPHATMFSDERVHLYGFILETPLLVGDSLRLDFQVQQQANAPLWANDRIRTNGTYLNGFHILPSLGVRPVFLGNAKERRAYGLPEQAPKLAELLPSKALLGYENPKNTMDRLRWTTTVSTSADQVAIAPGTLVKSWRAGNRRYFRYRTEQPTEHQLSWFSGRYDQLYDAAGQLPVVYHHLAEHRSGLSQLRPGIRYSLDMNTRQFGPLPYDTLKFVEFPHHSGSHATLHGNLIPTSEVYLQCDVDHHDNEVFNVPFFVGAHETAHFWWGQEVDPANVPGGRFITEGLADYLATEAVREAFGPEFAHEIRKTWRKAYFRQRAANGNEVPLVAAPPGDGFDYLNYRKASLAFHGLAGYLGKERLLEALNCFADQYRHAPPPYATANDLVEILTEYCPDSLQYLISDFCNDIILYDNRIASVTTTPSAEGYELTITFRVSKYRSGPAGERLDVSSATEVASVDGHHSIPLADYVDLAAYQGKKLLLRQRVKCTETDNVLRWQLAILPDRLVLDPDLLLLDQDTENNEWSPKAL